ncbi:hypothetical protein AX16_004656 [Volvariella volvacea WC 439]|nr:hypothetical protein AX16_004656 [Volvariella volvacea WC 439]
MSRSIRRFHSSLRALRCSNSPFLPSSTPASRRCMQVAAQKKPEASATPTHAQTFSRRPGDNVAASVDESDMDSEASQKLTDEEKAARRLEKVETALAGHLNGLFAPLQFPPELARRILTHGSHPMSTYGHNAGLTFMGRRVLEAYLYMFLNSSSALSPKHDLDAIISQALNTYVLGERVGSKWGVGKVLRWTPRIPASQLQVSKLSPTLLKDVGLYKVQGDAVAAIMGGIFYQFGGSVAHRVFHTRLLPHLVTWNKTKILPVAFHADVMAIGQKMGGAEGPLLLDSAQEGSEKIHATSS